MTAKKPGMAVITIKTMDGSANTVQVTITVEETNTDLIITKDSLRNKKLILTGGVYNNVIIENSVGSQAMVYFKKIKIKGNLILQDGVDYTVAINYASNVANVLCTSDVAGAKKEIAKLSPTFKVKGSSVVANIRVDKASSFVLVSDKKATIKEIEVIHKENETTDLSLTTYNGALTIQGAEKGKLNVILSKSIIPKVSIEGTATNQQVTFHATTESTLKKIEANAPSSQIIINGMYMNVSELITKAKGVFVSIIEKAKVGTLILNGESTFVRVEKDALINQIDVKEKGGTIQGEGSVRNITVSADNTKIETIGTKIKVSNDVKGTIAGGISLNAGAEITTGSHSSDQSTSNSSSEESSSSNSSTIKNSELEVAIEALRKILDNYEKPTKLLDGVTLEALENVETLVNKVPQADRVNLQKKVDLARAFLRERTLKEIEEAEKAIQIKFAEGESETSVKNAFELPKTGLYGTEIRWESDSDAIVIKDGVVAIQRPPYQDGNKEVILRAFVQKYGILSTTAVVKKVVILSIDKTALQGAVLAVKEATTKEEIKKIFKNPDYVAALELDITNMTTSLGEDSSYYNAILEALVVMNKTGLKIEESEIEASKQAIATEFNVILQKQLTIKTVEENLKLENLQVKERDTSEILGDVLQIVTAEDLKLPRTLGSAENKLEVSWSSNREDVIQIKAIDGHIVVNPLYQHNADDGKIGSITGENNVNDDTNVTLTAVVTNAMGEEVKTISFEIRVRETKSHLNYIVEIGKGNLSKNGKDPILSKKDITDQNEMTAVADLKEATSILNVPSTITVKGFVDSLVTSFGSSIVIMDNETELDQTDEIRLEASKDRYRVIVIAEDGINKREYSVAVFTISADKITKAEDEQYTNKNYQSNKDVFNMTFLADNMNTIQIEATKECKYNTPKMIGIVVDFEEFIVDAKTEIINLKTMNAEVLEGTKVVFWLQTNNENREEVKQDISYQVEFKDGDKLPLRFTYAPAPKTIAKQYVFAASRKMNEEYINIFGENGAIEYGFLYIVPLEKDGVEIKRLTLPTEVIGSLIQGEETTQGPLPVMISWKFSEENNVTITEDGTVRRPKYTDDDKVITVNITFTSKEINENGEPLATLYDSFRILIKKETATDLQVAIMDANALKTTTSDAD